MTALVMLSFGVSNAQIKNAKTETIKIYGNCGMCESTIEKAGNIKKTAIVDWNKDTKMATITYDAKKTNLLHPMMCMQNCLNVACTNG